MTESSRRAPIRVALVGVGYIADYHYDAVRTVPGAEVTAVCDVARGRAQRFADSKGIAAAYGSVDEMMRAEQLDVVHVLTPPHLHEQPTKIALEHGADALVEKPLCHDSGATGRLRALAAERGRALGCSHNFLFFPAYDRLVADLRSGRLGAVDQLDIVWNKPLGQLKGGPFGAWMLQQPQNILFEVAPHSFAHLAHLLGGQPDEIAVHPFDRVELPRGLSFWRRWEILAWKGSTQARVRLSFIDGYPEHYIHVRGSQAVARCDFENSTYVCLDHTPHLLDVDRFLTVANTSKDAVVQAGETLAGFVLTKMGMSKSGGPFQLSISRIVQTFYGGRGGVLDERVSAEVGEAAVIIAERVASKAELPTVAAKATRPTTSPTGAPSPKVLVIGGTGFIGRALVKRLRADGLGVRVVVRDPAGCPPELQDPGVDVCRGDFTDLGSIAAAMGGIDYVYHLARGNGNTWAEFLKYDVEPTRALAELCLQHEVQRFFYTSSIALYYAGKGAGTITEDTPPARPDGPYARSKVENEANLMALHKGKGLPLVLFRPGIVLGRGGCPLHWGIAGWPYPSVARLWGDGNTKLPIVLVDDCADAMVRALRVPGIEGRSYNLVGPPLVTANEYLDELEARAGIRLRRVPTSSWTYFGEALAKWAIKKVGRDPNAQRPTYADWEGRTFAATLDGSRAMKELGWEPTRERSTVIREGIWVPTEEWFELPPRGR